MTLTVRELKEALEDLDEDIYDFKVVIDNRFSLNGLEVTGRSKLIEVSESVDIEKALFILRAKG